MSRKQKLTWILNGLLLIAIACASSWIDDAQGARTLARCALGMLVLISIRAFWISTPTISRTQARVNKVQRRHARARAARSGGVVA